MYAQPTDIAFSTHVVDLNGKITAVINLLFTKSSLFTIEDYCVHFNIEIYYVFL